MRNQAILKILGVLLLLFSITLLPPLAVSLTTADGAWLPFLIALAVNFALGIACWLPPTLKRARADLRLRDGFLVVVLFWTVLSAMGALPLLLMRAPSLTAIDALFESMSGLTTTGATILTAIDHLPPSILYYRQQLQWLGGMGIVVLAVAVMPMLGVGGMQLYRAETPGPMKDNKLTPRITETAKGLWYIYLALTAICALAYHLAGMSVFDAIGHAFSTIAIGGFSTHDANLGYFQSNAIYAVAMFFMVLSGLNFALHFTAWRKRPRLPVLPALSVYARDPEARAYFALLLIALAIALAVLLHHQTFPTPTDTFIQGAMQVISLVTTTGFTITEFSAWPSFLPIMLILCALIGGCAGSTAGGMKIIRMLLLCKQGSREISQLVHPHAVLPIKLGGVVIPEAVLNAVWGFLALYFISFALLVLLMSASGADIVTAFSAVAACLNNLGPGLGEVAHDYAALTDPSKAILIFAMLLGRLELFTLLVLFTPVFWKS